MESSVQALPVQSMNILTTEQLRDAWVRGKEVEFGDPAMARTQFHLTGTFYPLGFPLTISTNCQEVLDAAAESWGGFTKLFEIDPIRLDVGVTEAGTLDCPPVPVGRMREHVFTNVANAENFAAIDLAQGYCLIWITRAALKQPTYFRYFYLESTAACCIVNRHAVGIHAGCVDLDGVGILLCGDSGAGKSTLAYSCARAGWSYVTDDASFLVQERTDRLVVGNSSVARFRPASESFFPELRNRRVVHRAEKGKPSIELAIPPRAVRSSVQTRIQHVVFLNRLTGREELVPFPVEVAKLYIMQRVNSVPGLRFDAEGAVDNLLDIGTLELCYSDLDWAVERLTRLAREGR